MNKDGLSIEGKEVVKYLWDDIEKVILIFKGVRFYQVLQFKEGKEIEFEFSEKWIYSAFNSSKGIIHNHNKLMVYFGDLKQFTDRIDVQHYDELIGEFNLPSPKWFKATKL